MLLEQELGRALATILAVLVDLTAALGVKVAALRTPDKRMTVYIRRGFMVAEEEQIDLFLLDMAVELYLCKQPITLKSTEQFEQMVAQRPRQESVVEQAEVYFCKQKIS